LAYTRFALSDLDHDRLRRGQVPIPEVVRHRSLLYHTSDARERAPLGSGSRPIAINAGGDIAGTFTDFEATFFTASRATAAGAISALTLLAQTTLGDARSFVQRYHAAGTIVRKLLWIKLSSTAFFAPERHLHTVDPPQ